MDIIASGQFTITDLSDGIGILRAVVMYYGSTSNTELIGGEWSEVSPEWTPDMYIWSKTVIVYDDEDHTTEESDPVCIMGYHGADGKGIRSIEALYYISESNSRQDIPDDETEWSNEAPQWSFGKYIWTRTKFTYTDDTVELTEPQCDSGWEAVNGLIIGGRNYILYSKDMYYEGYHELLPLNPLEPGSLDAIVEYALTNINITCAMDLYAYVEYAEADVHYTTPKRVNSEDWAPTVEP